MGAFPTYQVLTAVEQDNENTMKKVFRSLDKNVDGFLNLLEFTPFGKGINAFYHSLII